MTNTEAIIRTILGPIRRDTRPLACSVDCLSELLFVQKIPMDEIMVTKDIYPEVAKQLNKNPRTISRSVERLVLCCWEEGNRAYLAKIIGRNLTTLREPSCFISPSILTGMSRFSPLSRRSPPCCFEI